MNTNTLDLLAKELAAEYENNMACRRAISLALAAVKERAAKGEFESSEAASSELLRQVRGLNACKKRGNIARKRTRSTARKRGTKYQSK